MDVSTIRVDPVLQREIAALFGAVAEQEFRKALTELKKANGHDNWRCSERKKINEELSEVDAAIERLIEKTKGMQQAFVFMAVEFENAEQILLMEEQRLSGELRTQRGFEKPGWFAGAVASIQSMWSSLRARITGRPVSGGSVPVSTSIPQFNMQPAQPAQHSVLSKSDSSW